MQVRAAYASPADADETSSCLSRSGIEIVRQGGTYLIVGYGGELQVPTMLLIRKEATIIGNLVGSYGDLSELIALAAAGQVELHTVQYDLEAAPQASTTSTTGASTAVRW
jgi:D-arabinose 1-dehydrogenase-like Zn-dependent alcohol dehydrogenase